MGLLHKLLRVQAWEVKIPWCYVRLCADADRGVILATAELECWAWNTTVERDLNIQEVSSIAS